MNSQKSPIKPKAWQHVLLIALIMVLAINLLGYIPQPQNGSVPSLQSNLFAATKVVVPVAGIVAIILVLMRRKKK